MTTPPTQPPPGRHRRWMPDSKLRGFARGGASLEEIRRANEIATGYLPTRPTVSKRLKRLGEPRRSGQRRDLLPWHIKPEHNGSRFRYMLQAVSRSREPDAELSDTDLRHVDLLYDLLFGRGVDLVVGYHPEVGFYLCDRSEDDLDIIRVPQSSE